MSLVIDPKQIKALSPINSLNPENVQELISKISAVPLDSGHYVFKKGDTEKSHVYVLQGEIELVHDKKVVKLIKAGTPKEEVAEPKFEEGLRMYLWKNVKDLANELSIAFGLTTREELEKAKKEVEKLSRKKQLAS